jgi:hypothetical protein
LEVVIWIQRRLDQGSYSSQPRPVRAGAKPQEMFLYFLLKIRDSSESWIPVQDVAQLLDYENPELEEVGQYR